MTYRQVSPCDGYGVYGFVQACIPPVPESTLNGRVEADRGPSDYLELAKSVRAGDNSDQASPKVLGDMSTYVLFRHSTKARDFWLIWDLYVHTVKCRTCIVVFRLSE